MNDDSRSRRPPIVGMDNNRRGRRVDIALVDTPANVVPACDGSRGAHCGERQKAGTRASCHESFSHWRHFHSQIIHIFLLLWTSSFCSNPRRKRPQTSFRFRGRTLKLPLMGKVTQAKKHFTTPRRTARQRRSPSSTSNSQPAAQGPDRKKVGFSLVERLGFRVAHLSQEVRTWHGTFSSRSPS